MAQLEELKTVKLTGNENYQIWKFQIGIILKSMKNGDLLNTEKPADAAKLRDWTHVENSAQRIIVTSVSEKVLSLLFACDSSKTMLEKLDAVYGHKSDASLHTLQQKFYGATYNKEDGIGGHISKLEHLVSQMKNLGETVSEGMLVAKILNTLPPEFSHFHSAWDSTPKGEQTSSNLTARLLIEEERLKNKNPEQKSENKEENTALINQNEKDHPPNLRNVKDEVPYREAVGSLMFLAVISRPDISYAVSRVSQYLENPKTIHWNAVKKILKYLQGTVEYGLFYQPEGNLEGYSDADFAGDTQDRKSTSGYVFQFCGTAISWASRKQRLVVLSTTEAEFVAASEASREAIWLRNLFLDLTGEEQTIPLYVDNKSTICVLKNEITSKRSKHYDIRYYYVKDLIKEKIIAVMYVNTKNQRADIFTKGLNRDNFVRLRNNLGLTKI
ncbi:hypothetical protein V9T40_000548 [Parthenolecanium corni]|uniref:Retrovirus-related Pol polyprotein from transposon TNT 1-94 n=1 Tax=Parthenolecanium corni TaxID=536013 RepID=A0AAN9TBD0_9HEMI